MKTSLLLFLGCVLYSSILAIAEENGIQQAVSLESPSSESSKPIESGEVEPESEDMQDLSEVQDADDCDFEEPIDASVVEAEDDGEEQIHDDYSKEEEEQLTGSVIEEESEEAVGALESQEQKSDADQEPVLESEKALELCESTKRTTEAQLNELQKSIEDLLRQKSKYEEQIIQFHQEKESQIKEFVQLKSSLEQTNQEYEELKIHSSKIEKEMKTTLENASKQQHSRDHEKDELISRLKGIISENESRIKLLEAQLKTVEEDYKRKLEENASASNAKAAINLEQQIEELKVALDFERTKRQGMEDELNFHRQGIYVVAFHRFMEHIDHIYEEFGKFYEETAKPRLDEVMSKIGEELRRIYDLVEDTALPAFKAQLMQLEPQLKQLYQPYADYVQP